MFITGTDTNVGKTWVAAALVRHWRKTGMNPVGMKPVACGDRNDAELLQEASGGGLTLDDVNPVWLRPAVAPYTAAMIEERVIDLSLIRETFTRLKSGHDSVIVEGAGGWLVPILRDFAVSDLAADLGLPVVVVAANRLGVLNHALLTVESILARGLRCAGVLLNQVNAMGEFDPAMATNPGILEDLLSIRNVLFLGEMEHGSDELPPRCAELLSSSVEV